MDKKERKLQASQCYNPWQYLLAYFFVRACACVIFLLVSFFFFVFILKRLLTVAKDTRGRECVFVWV